MLRDLLFFDWAMRLEMADEEVVEALEILLEFMNERRGCSQDGSNTGQGN